jgi:hypothetical protein
MLELVVSTEKVQHGVLLVRANAGSVVVAQCLGTIAHAAAAAAAAAGWCRAAPRWVWCSGWTARSRLETTCLREP